jgi:hypothetical protein
MTDTTKTAQALVRMPKELKVELDRQAARLRLSINDVIVEGIKRIVETLKKKESPF